MSRVGTAVPRSGALDAIGRFGWSLRWHAGKVPQRLVEAGLPPARLGWHWLRRDTPARYLDAVGATGDRLTRIHPAQVVRNPLPANVDRRDRLDPDPGWWGFSFRDVPERVSGETCIARLPDIRIVAYRDGPRHDFTVGMIGREDRAIDLPQVRLRPPHGPLLERREPPARLARATWILERVYDNHSHWLTAHLPKLRLLQERGELDNLVLPAERTPAIDASLAMLGLDPARCHAFDPARVLEVEELTVLVTDRLRPELLRPVRAALAPQDDAPASRRVFISRARARGRKLLDEQALWRQLEPRGFERIFMEELDFSAQVRLMHQTAVLLAPHGAGLTNMMFCRSGAEIVEIADPAYPNPNFYALACAMGHRYWLLHAEAVGEGHALDKDLRVDPAAVEAVLDRIGGAA